MNEVYIAVPAGVSIQDFRALVLSDPTEWETLCQSFLADLDEEARLAALCRDFEDREIERQFMESDAWDREIATSEWFAG